MPPEPALHLSVQARAALIAAARARWPFEACGVLLGEDAAPSPPRVAAALALDNVAAGHRGTTFALEPADLQRAGAQARARGLELIGFFHSHPGGRAWPSAEDEAAACWPGYHHLIVALDAAGAVDIGAFACTEAGWRAYPLREESA